MRLLPTLARRRALGLRCKSSHTRSFIPSDALTSPHLLPRCTPLFSTSRRLLSSMASAPPRWWRLPLVAAPDPPIRRVSRFPHGSGNMASGSGVRGEEESGKPNGRQHIHSAKDIMLSLGEHSKRINVKNSDTTKEFIARYGYGHLANIEDDGRRTSVDVNYSDEEAPGTTVEVTCGRQETGGKWGNVPMVTNRRATKGRDGETMVASDDEENVSCAAQIARYPVDRVVPLNMLPDSSHRDGSAYRDTYKWKKDYRIVDRRETRLEAMMLSDPMDCTMRDGTCMRHRPHRMLQIFSLKLAEIPVDAGSVELYGYIAARDDLEPLLNYVVNVSRDDPIIVEQGSLINMAPKRGIKLGGTTLIEYDMKIKTGEHEKDDLQLIDGISVIDAMDTSNCSVFTCRIIGDCGAIDISASCLDDAVEATVEIVISEVQGSFNMRLGCFVSELDEEIQLFDGTIVESCGLEGSVVAVVMGTQMDLKFKLGSGPSCFSDYHCSFKAHNHGHVNELIKTDFASISVKVTWSVLPSGWTSLQALLKSYGRD